MLCVLIKGKLVSKSGELNTEALTWMIIEKKYYMSNPPSLLYHSTQATYVPMYGPPAKKCPCDKALCGKCGNSERALP